MQFGLFDNKVDFVGEQNVVLFQLIGRVEAEVGYLREDFDLAMPRIVGELGSLNKRIDIFEQKVERRFEATDKRIDTLDLRVRKVEMKVDAVDQKVDALTGRMDSFDEKLDLILASVAPKS